MQQTAFSKAPCDARTLRLKRQGPALWLPGKAFCRRAFGEAEVRSGRSYARFPRDAQHAFYAARSADLDVFLELISASLVQLAFRDFHLHQVLRAQLDSTGDSGELEDLTDAAVGYLARALAPRLSLPPDRLLMVTRLMVWSADGLFEGALRQGEISGAGVQAALLSAWPGILAN
jgi:hypothetical protein